jgi:putative inorganic carbon (HCO3(-)) transporter
MRRLAYLLMLAMVFTLPWENVLELPGLGRVSKLLGLLVAVAWVATVVTTGRTREPHTAHLLALLFVVWNAFSLMWTVDGDATQVRVLTYVQLFALMLVVWDTVDTRARLRATLTSYLAGSYVTVTALLLGYFLGTAAERHGRVTVGSFHPNDVGMILAISVPVAAYLMWEPVAGRWGVLWVTFCASYVPLAGFAVLATGSRAALVSMLPGFVYLFWRLARSRPVVAAVTLAGLGGMGVMAIPFVPAQVILRLQGTDAALRAGNLNERQIVWAEAVRLIREHPLLGSGGGAFRVAAVGANKVAHNLALGLLAEVGIIGFGLFAAMLVVALLSLRHIEPNLRAMWAAVFVAWLGAALLHNWEYRKQTWLMIALVLVCGALSTEDEAPPAEAGANGDDAPAVPASRRLP